MRISLAVEIGEEYLKFAAARTKGIHAQSFDCYAAPRLNLTDKDVVTALGNILKKSRYKSRFVIVSLSRNFVTVRNLHLPSKDQEEISKMIGLHIDRIVPYKREDVIFGYRVAGIDEMEYTRLVLAIVHSEVIRKQIAVLDEAGFLVDRIILSSYGVWQWVLNNHRSEINQSDLYLSLDIDTTFTDFIVFSRDELLFTRSIAIKAGELNDELARRKFLGEVRQSLLIFQNEEVNNQRPVKVFLSGITHLDLTMTIEQELSIKVRTVNPPLSLEAMQDKEKIPDKDISFTSVAELVSEEKPDNLSFVLPEIQIRKSLREKIKELVVFGSLVICVFALICSSFLAQIYNRENYLNELKDRYAKIGGEVTELVQQVDNIRFVKNYLISRQGYIYVIAQLQKVIPSSISLTFVSIDEANKVVLRGQAYKLSDVFKLISDLGDLPFFADIETKYTRQRKVKDSVVTDFELNLAFDKNKKKAASAANAAQDNPAGRKTISK